MQFIASGLLGPQAFQGGLATAALGLALHFFIAFTLVAVFYAARRNVSISATACGLFRNNLWMVVYAVMNLVVLPLSAAKPRHSLSGT